MKVASGLLAVASTLWLVLDSGDAFSAPPQPRRLVATPSSSSSTTSLSSTTITDLSSLPLPPTKKGLFRRFRDTFGYLKDPERFVLQRSQELDSPVFQMYQFFQPVVVVGGQAAVQEFIQQREGEAKVIYPDLPPAFKDLHTEWSALNMDSTQDRFKEARFFFKNVLQSPEARSLYVQSILPEVQGYVDTLAQRVEEDPQVELKIVPELKELCLQIFARIFSGQSLTQEQIQQFYDYNEALLSISQQSKQYKKGEAALEGLSAEMLRRFEILEARAAQGGEEVMGEEGMFVFQCLRDAPGYLDEKNYERISISMLLMIWAAYVECAALMATSIVAMLEHKIDPASTVLQEVRDQIAKGQDKSSLSFWDGLKYTNGIVKESLRTMPPGAGLARYGERDFQLAGYRIPKGLSVQMDPRIGNQESTLFENADSFEPLRWVSGDLLDSTTPAASSSCPFKGTALKLGAGSWFPGGNGAHRCPGVPLAELITTMFLASVSENFESWELGGSGLNSDGSVKFVNIPIHLPSDEFGLKFKPRQ